MILIKIWLLLKILQFEICNGLYFSYFFTQLKLHQQKILQDVLNMTQRGPCREADFANAKEFTNKKENVSEEAGEKYIHFAR